MLEDVVRLLVVNEILAGHTGRRAQVPSPLFTVEGQKQWAVEAFLSAETLRSNVRDNRRRFTLELV
jgi:hypothetical protein